MNKKNIITLLFVVVVVAFAGFYLFKKDDIGSDYISTETKVNQSKEASDIYINLQKMAKVKLDTSIFSNKVFKILVDNSIDIGSQDKIRQNPFAPIESNIVKTK